MKLLRSLIAMLALIPNGAAQEPGLPSRGLCAHRGAMATHPENTLPAFREAVRAGAHMIEFDVYLTKDKQPVVIHDSTVDRTTNGKGRVADLTLAQVRQLDAGSSKDPRFAGERVPTLRETLAVMPLNVWLNVHLKGGAELSTTVVKVLAGEGRLRHAFLACGREAAEAAQAAEPKVLIGNMERQEQLQQYVDDTVATKAAFIQFLNVPLADYRGHIERLRSRGVNVNYCCTDDPEGLRAAFAAGVQFPLVNNIQAAMKVAREAGIEPLQPVFR